MQKFIVVLAGVVLAAAPVVVPAPVAAEGGATVKAPDSAKPEAPPPSPSLPSPSEIERIKELVKQLGADNFEVREKAAAELPAFGRKALPFLEAAARSPDLEVANRARGLAFRLLWPFDAAEAGRRQKEAAEALGVPVEKAVDLGGGVKLELVLIPAGTFEMGSPDGEAGRQPAEGPVHRVRITKPFYVGKHEVTQEQWEKVMGNNPAQFKGPKNPVEQVTWDDCQAFMKKLNESFKGKAEFRLPTEAEWEYACRAGSKGRFCFGDSDDELGKYAWYDGNALQKTHPVGEKKPNAWGLYDCHGNAWEWCQDWYGAYGGAEVQDDPTGPDKGSARVLRGGAWINLPGYCRSAFRNYVVPSTRYYLIGFRVVGVAVSAGP